MNRVNNWIALRLTKAVGSMWCAYAFVALAILGFPPAGSDLSAYIAWTSQTFIQLVMLSVIMVGQDLMSERHAEHSDKLDALHHHLGVDTPPRDTTS